MQPFIPPVALCAMSLASTGDASVDGTEVRALVELTFHRGRQTNEYTQADLGDVAGCGPDHRPKANMAIQ